MPVARQQLLDAVERDFAAGDASAVLAIVDEYGAEPNEPEPERVRLAIVRLAAGDREMLQKLLYAARYDYRDVLAWADAGPLSAEDGERLQAAARKLLARWGTS
ncbi:hypothetical protein K2Z84_21735 [Candidatus Binatia bacterium]|nr:hypothetical protein [Candidatus Binatia bacterium]